MEGTGGPDSRGRDRSGAVLETGDFMIVVRFINNVEDCRFNNSLFVKSSAFSCKVGLISKCLNDGCNNVVM